MQEKTYYRKKYLCLLLALVMLMGLFPSSIFAVETENHYSVSQDNDNNHEYDLYEQEVEEELIEEAEAEFEEDENH